MAQNIGDPGKYLQKKEFRYYGIAAILFVGMVLFVYFLPKLVFLSGSVFGLLFIFLIFKVFTDLFPDLIKIFRKKGDNYHNGRQGENEIVEELNKLPDGYSILRNIKFENGPDNDIVVVGPTGIFTLEVKDYDYAVVSFNNNKLTFNNREDIKNILNQAFTEAINLQKVLLRDGLQSFVNPVIVFSSPMKLNFGFNKVKNVFVIGKPYLTNLITSQPNSLSNEKTEEIVNILKKYV